MGGTLSCWLSWWSWWLYLEEELGTSWLLRMAVLHFWGVSGSHLEHYFLPPEKKMVYSSVPWGSLSCWLSACHTGFPPVMFAFLVGIQLDVIWLKMPLGDKILFDTIKAKGGNYKVTTPVLKSLHYHYLVLRSEKVFNFAKPYYRKSGYKQYFLLNGINVMIKRANTYRSVTTHSTLNCVETRYFHLHCHDHHYHQLAVVQCNTLPDYNKWSLSALALQSPKTKVNQPKCWQKG